MTHDEEICLDLSPRTTQLVELARETLGTMSLCQHNKGLLRIAARSSDKRKFWFTPIAAGAATIAIAAAVVVVKTLPRHSHGTAPLSYEIEAGAAGADGLLQAGSANRPRVRFSDGTDIQLTEGTRARIASVSESGARVVLDRGQVHAHVIHWAGARWLFDAGPFVVTVTGTAFALSWTPDDDRLDLRLENGSVAVSGPASAEPIALRAGQWLTVWPRKREVLIRDLASTPGADTVPITAPVHADSAENPGVLPTSSTATAAGVSAREPPPATEPKRDWSRMLAAGKLNAIVEDAQRRGLDVCLADSSSSDLSALADAARYTRRGDIARRVLLAQRKRFAGTRKAEEAAFLLGRLSEAQEGAVAALVWFERYLNEAPNGSYASEALGRKMTLVHQVYGRDRAQIIAREYLRRFSGGTYAQAAQALVLSP